MGLERLRAVGPLVVDFGHIKREHGRAKYEGRNKDCEENPDRLKKQLLHS